MYATSLRLPDELGKRLDALAKETGRTKTFYILQAVKEHLDDLEDMYLAERRLNDIRAGRARTLSSEEVEKMMHVED